MLDHHALGRAGRAGGVDDIGEMMRGQAGDGSGLCVGSACESRIVVRQAEHRGPTSREPRGHHSPARPEPGPPLGALSFSMEAQPLGG